MAKQEVLVNRVQDAIVKLRSNPGLESVPDNATTISFQEHAYYQGIQSVAFASEKLSLEEAAVVYKALGEAYSKGNNGWVPGVDKATKITVIILISELAGVA